MKYKEGIQIASEVREILPNLSVDKIPILDFSHPEHDMRLHILFIIEFLKKGFDPNAEQWG